MKLYTYFRSSASYRVRIALNLKGIQYDTESVHLLKSGGQQNSVSYRALSPLGLVPCLETDAGGHLTQSLAIIEYLEEVYPDAPLLPVSPGDRARVRGIAQTISCDIHPLNNLRVLNFLTGKFGLSVEDKEGWYSHWLTEGLLAIERMLIDDPRTGRFCHGNTPGLADCCLIPQVFNARRFNCSLERMPTIQRICLACEELISFHAASPVNQPDAEPENN
ncbi:maleylacetoacetate isomerase [Enterobacter sp. JBIWA005]|uniref:maleylacetoacetate isomerase n=1 Tax=Enterobacter sp. JBIWA005 TaxID=2831891 RepID=UPI001CBEA40D|nr:maleylacetoacetate isomerase [Enterobacter sp. JBIWA005]UAN34288.1 maleylacetoacetate isomerase [Enterobacter sp. JBIWA005]